MDDEFVCDACKSRRDPSEIWRRSTEHGAVVLCDICLGAPMTPWLTHKVDRSLMQADRQLIHLAWFLVDRLAPKREE